MRVLKLLHSRARPRTIYCPECMMPILKKFVPKGVELEHGVIITQYYSRGIQYGSTFSERSQCSRAGQKLFIPQTSRVKCKTDGTGIPFLQVRPPGCPNKCHWPLDFEFMSCGLRVRLYHGDALRFARCKTEIIHPIARYIVFI